MNASDCEEKWLKRKSLHNVIFFFYIFYAATKLEFISRLIPPTQH